MPAAQAAGSVRRRARRTVTAITTMRTANPIWPSESRRKPSRIPSLPTADDVALFAQHDSLYRWLLKGTAPQPEDRFQSADEMRDEAMGRLGLMKPYLRPIYVGAQASGTAVTVLLQHHGQRPLVVSGHEVEPQGVGLLAVGLGELRELGL